MITDKEQLGVLVKIMSYYQRCYPYEERIKSDAYNKVCARADKLAQRIIKAESLDKCIK